MKKQRVISEVIHEQTELNPMVEKKSQQEEKWLVRTIQMEKEAKEGTSSVASGTTESVQLVKLQKYTTGFDRVYKDWSRFCNRLSVEVG